MLDLLIRKANLPDGRRGVDIAVANGCIVEVGPNIDGKAQREIDATDRLASPPFVDSHFHMDSTLSYGQPRVNASGTLLEGIELWRELKPHLTVENIKARAMQLCHWAIARGTLAIRSHVDVSDDRLLAVNALLEVREEIKPYIDLQLVAFPQDGYFRYPAVESRILKEPCSKEQLRLRPCVNWQPNADYRWTCTVMKVTIRFPVTSKP